MPESSTRMHFIDSSTGILLVNAVQSQHEMHHIQWLSKLNQILLILCGWPSYFLCNPTNRVTRKFSKWLKLSVSKSINVVELNVAILENNLQIFV